MNLHCFIVASNALWYLWFGDSHSLFKHEYGAHETIASASYETTASVCYYYASLSTVNTGINYDGSRLQGTDVTWGWNAEQQNYTNQESYHWWLCQTCTRKPGAIASKSNWRAVRKFSSIWSAEDRIIRHQWTKLKVMNIAFYIPLNTLVLHNF